MADEAGTEHAQVALGGLLRAPNLAVVAYDLGGQVLACSPAALQLFGWTASEAVGARVPWMAPHSPRGPGRDPAPDSTVELAPLRRMRAYRGDGASIEVQVAFSAPLRNPRGEAVGAVAAFENLSAGDTPPVLDDCRERYRILAEAAFEAIFVHERGRLIDVNTAATELFGYTREEMIGMDGLLLVAPQDRARTRDNILRQYEDPYEAMGVRKDGSRVYLEIRGRPLQVDGTLLRVTVVRDISARRLADIQAERLLRERAARLATEEAARRVEIVSEATRMFASSLDAEETLRRVCNIVVPTLADWCITYLTGTEDEANRQEIAHVNREKVALLRTLLERYPPDYESAEHPVGRVIQSGKPQFVPELPDGMLAGLAHDREHLEILEELGFHSYMLVPLVVRGRVAGAIAFVTAESRRRYTEDDLKVAQEIARRAAVALDHARLYEAALEANRVKAGFLATMSHELRTPLNAMIGYTDLLTAGIPEPIPAASRQYVERIGRSARHLLGLIEEILTFSRLEAGREQADVSRVDVADLVAEVLSLTEPLAHARGLRFSVRNDVTVDLYTDTRKLRQMLLNLLGNAIKYTEAGTVDFHGWSEENQVFFAVRDTGIGIAETDLERVFEPFWQVRSEHTRTAEGTGLGLSVTRRLAEFLGGELLVESQIGVGSTFTIRLPAVGPHTRSG